MNEEELLKKLREAFSEESRERLASLSSSLLSLEKGVGGEEKARNLEVAFREAHSLKGAARSVNLSEIETICQAVEGVFAAMKRDEINMSGDLFDLLHHSVRMIEDFLAAPEAARPERMGEIASLVSQLQGVQTGREVKVPERKAGGEPGPIEEKTPLKPPPSESVRVSIAKLDSLFFKTEELVTLKLSSDQQLTDLKTIARSIEDWNKRWAEMERHRKALQGMATQGDALDNLDRFLDWNRDFIRTLGAGLRTLTKGSSQKDRTLGLMVDDLLNDMKRVAMLPFSTLLDIFPRMVREISREQGKDVDLRVKGGEVEIDRRILEEMRDPVTHILRNCVDHGLESPEEREKLGKPGTGTIELTVSQVAGGKVEVLISDDGPGIDLAQVKRKAQGLGIMTEQELEALDERDALSLVLRSGVSTSPIITDISGRGLGLAIVQEKVEKLGGLLSLDTA
ncbi:MAG TPA: hybrid sensor histidine kinase/response regulator, partial [Desulfobacteraceae bacterium]|nr:hybrid sensor histidine kinase/response regulator [Desulfobacteraceae bacterium]